MKHNILESFTEKYKENKEYNLIKKNNEIFVKAQKINQNSESDITISDLDFDDENKNNFQNHSSKNVNSEEDKETNFISSINENDCHNKKRIVKFNLDKKENDKKINNNILNTTRKPTIINKYKYKTINNNIPGDFVPKIGVNDIIRNHVQLIPSNYEYKKTHIHVHNLDNIFNKSFDDFKKSNNNLKFVTLYDNPKYSYLEENHNNSKVHKSNLFQKNRIKQK